MQSAAKVGALLIVFIVLIVGAYSILGNSFFAPKTDLYYGSFQDAGGIVAGTRVLMAGVKIGTVADVQLVSPTEAKMTLALTQGTKLPRGSHLEIAGSLIGFGEIPLQIIAGTEREELPPGSTIPGLKAGALDSILPGGGKETVNILNATLLEFQKMLKDGKLQAKTLSLLESTNETMKSVSALSQNANVLVSKMNTFMGANQANLTAAISAGTKAVADVQQVTLAFSKLAQSGKLQGNITAIMATLEQTTKKADSLVASMNSLINDPRLRDPLAKTMSNVADITGTGKEIATNTAAMTKDGTKISANAVSLTEKMNEIATKASSIEDQLKGVLDKVGGVLGKGASGPSLPNLTYEFDLLRSTKPNHWRTDFSLTAPMGDQKLNLGIYDAFEANKLTIQMERPISSKFAAEYGIYASKPGLGVDYAVTPKIHLLNNLWDLDDPNYDSRLKVDFGDGLIGWLGIDRIFKDNAATIGFGIKK